MKKLLIVLLSFAFAFALQAQTYTANKFITKDNGNVELNNNGFYARLKASASASADYTIYMPPAAPSDNTLWGFSSGGVTRAVTGVKGISILSGEIYIDTVYAATRYSVGNLIGITSTATTLGTFTGSTISDNVSVKVALQSLETSLETKQASATALTTSTNFTGGDISGLWNNLQIGAGTVGPTELANTAVTPGTYTYATVTIDQQGRATSVSSGTTPSNFANTDLTFTAARSHAGAGFSYAMTNVSSYSFGLSSGSRTLSLSSTAFTANTEVFEIRNVAGQSTAEAVLRLYEDRDNGSPNEYVGLKAPSSVGTTRTWTVPDADATTTCFWLFNSSEIGSLVTYSSTSFNAGEYSANFGGASIFIGNQAGLSSSDMFSYNTTKGRLMIGSNTITPGTMYDAMALVYNPSSNSNPVNSGIRIMSYIFRPTFGDTITLSETVTRVTTGTLGSESAALQYYTKRAGTRTLQATLSALGDWSVTSLTLGKTITAGGTTGDRTINTATGSVNLAAAATSLTVTNSLVTTSSVIQCTVATDDATLTSCKCIAGSGSFVVKGNAAATAETRINFTVTN